MSAVLATATAVKPDIIERRVMDVVKEVLGLDEAPSDLDAPIHEALALNSLDQLSLYMALEDEFGGHIDEDDAARIKTLRDVVEHVREQTSPAQHG